MKKLPITLAALAVLAVAGSVVLAAGLKSGPQVGEEVPGPFEPLNVTGPDAGEHKCLYCKNGPNPVAMIFARDVSEPVVTLIKKVDAATAEHKDARMGSFVVFLSDDKALPEKLKAMAEKENIKHTILSVDAPKGPALYEVSPDADVTVVLYTDHMVKANYAYGKGELKDKDVSRVLGDVTKILPEK
jgi:hypothetical protein